MSKRRLFISAIVFWRHTLIEWKCYFRLDLLSYFSQRLEHFWGFVFSFFFFLASGRLFFATQSAFFLCPTSSVLVLLPITRVFVSIAVRWQVTTFRRFTLLILAATHVWHPFNRSFDWIFGFRRAFLCRFSFDFLSYFLFSHTPTHAFDWGQTSWLWKSFWNFFWSTNTADHSCTDCFGKASWFDPWP